MIKAIIFDLGGVITSDIWEHLLLDNKTGIAVKYGLNPEKASNIGKTLWRIYSLKKANKKNNIRQLEKEYLRQLNQKLNISIPFNRFTKLCDKNIKPVRGMAEILERLKRKGLRLAICSDNTEFWFERQRVKLGLDKYILPDHYILSSRIGVSKADKSFGMFKASLDTLGVSKKHCLLIDDKIQNIKMATCFGFTTILFPSRSRFGAQYLRRILSEMGIY